MPPTVRSTYTGYYLRVLERQLAEFNPAWGTATPSRRPFILRLAYDPGLEPPVATAKRADHAGVAESRTKAAFQTAGIHGVLHDPSHFSTPAPLSALLRSGESMRKLAANGRWKSQSPTAASGSRRAHGPCGHNPVRLTCLRGLLLSLAKPPTPTSISPAATFPIASSPTSGADGPRSAKMATFSHR